MINSKLPKHLRARQIYMMQIHDLGYVSPWAIEVDQDDNMWIDVTSYVLDTPNEDMTVIIVRDTDHVRVNLESLKNEKYSPVSLVPTGYMPVVLV